jgi:molybdenum cofactor cytidylyltransferase
LDGTPGHPVLFGGRFFGQLSARTGDRGARSVIEASADCVAHVPTAGRTSLVDLDTPEDWEAWRAGRGGS